MKLVPGHDCAIVHGGTQPQWQCDEILVQHPQGISFIGFLEEESSPFVVQAEGIMNRMILAVLLSLACWAHGATVPAGHLTAAGLTSTVVPDAVSTGHHVDLTTGHDLDDSNSGNATDQDDDHGVPDDDTDDHDVDHDHDDGTDVDHDEDRPHHGNGTHELRAHIATFDWKRVSVPVLMCGAILTASLAKVGQ